MEVKSLIEKWTGLILGATGAFSLKLSLYLPLIGAVCVTSDWCKLDWPLSLCSEWELLLLLLLSRALLQVNLHLARVQVKGGVVVVASVLDPPGERSPGYTTLLTHSRTASWTHSGKLDRFIYRNSDRSPTFQRRSHPTSKTFLVHFN